MAGQYGPAPFVIAVIVIGILGVIIFTISIIKTGWRATVVDIKNLLLLFGKNIKDLWTK
jgi:hypothetical protein